jgi:hypothetical protein
MYYILLFLKISGPNLVYNCCLEFPVFEQILLEHASPEAVVDCLTVGK